MNRKKKAKVEEALNVACAMNGCDVICEDAWELNGHMSEHLKAAAKSDGDNYGCTWGECDFQSACLEEYKRHMYFHCYHSSLLIQGKLEIERNSSIPRCTLTADNREKIPDIPSNFKCNWTNCERSFYSIIEFQDHVTRHATFEYEIKKTPEDERPKMQCDWTLCKKELDGRYRLIEHICKHSNKKIAACWHCGEHFRTKTTLFDHCRRQPDNNTQKYQCAQCFKFYATEKFLRSHVVKHFNCFKCTMCDMTCPSSNALTTHIRYRHIKDRPFKCLQCDHRCVRQTDLNKHVKYAHSDEVHRCVEPGCSYTVRNYSLLRRHFMEVHGNSPCIYVCHCCDKLFKNAKRLSSHLVNVHEIEHTSGHKRFTYKMDEDGFYHLETMRIESLEVINQIIAPDPCQQTTQIEDGSCFDVISELSQNDDTSTVGKVLISLPNLS